MDEDQQEHHHHLGCLSAGGTGEARAQLPPVQLQGDGAEEEPKIKPSSQPQHRSGAREGARGGGGEAD